jgi:hypothetical protein
MKLPEFLKIRTPIPAVLLLTVLVAAIAVLVVFMLRISQLNDEIAGLHTLIAAEKDTSGDAPYRNQNGPGPKSSADRRKQFSEIRKTAPCAANTMLSAPKMKP